MSKKLGSSEGKTGWGRASIGPAEYFLPPDPRHGWRSYIARASAIGSYPPARATGALNFPLMASTSGGLQRVSPTMG